MRFPKRNVDRPDAHGRKQFNKKIRRLPTLAAAGPDRPRDLSTARFIRPSCALRAFNNTLCTLRRHLRARPERRGRQVYRHGSLRGARLRSHARQCGRYVSRTHAHVYVVCAITPSSSINRLSYCITHIKNNNNNNNKKLSARIRNNARVQNVLEPFCFYVYVIWCGKKKFEKRFRATVY